MRKVIQTSQKQTSDSEEERLMSLQEVFLVNPFPSQAKEREQTITVTSGLISLISRGYGVSFQDSGFRS